MVRALNRNDKLRSAMEFSVCDAERPRSSISHEKRMPGENARLSFSILLACHDRGRHRVWQSKRGRIRVAGGKPGRGVERNVARGETAALELALNGADQSAGLLLFRRLALRGRLV